VGTNKDYIVVGADSGRITVLQYQPETNELVTIHCETFGKTGCRRIVPGEYLAADPLGRAIMISELIPHLIIINDWWMDGWMGGGGQKKDGRISRPLNNSLLYIYVLSIMVIHPLRRLLFFQVP